MPIVTKYVCDRCEKFYDKPEEVKNVGVAVSNGNAMASSYNYNHVAIKIRKLWCHPCLKETGLLPYTKEEEKKQEPKKISLEDIIFDMIADEVNDRLANQ